MKITYLGTAAAEGWPALFCRCEYCMKAMKAGGRNIRTRSQAMLNDDLLFDFPSDSFHHMQQNRLDFSAVTAVLITHSHLDHFAPDDLHLRNSAYYAHNLTSDHLEFYGNERVIERMQTACRLRPEEPNADGLTIHLAKAYEPFQTGKYTVHPLRAFHALEENALNYAVSDGEKTILYLHDTGLLYDDVYEYLGANHIRADLVSYDCTYVALPSGGGHLGLDSCPVVRKRLEEAGVSDGKTISVINHFSHNGKLIHDELVPVAEELGFLTSYDGMVIEF